MNNLDPNGRYINGPINALRLEGEIHGIKKVIYIFMDWHFKISNQTQCDNIFSKDIQKYLAENFYKLNGKPIMYDFFLEIFPTELGKKLDTEESNRDIYIRELVTFFKKLFIYEPDKNKVSISDIISNVRLHYIDIRDYFHANFFDDILYLNKLADSFMKNFSIPADDLDEIIKTLAPIRDYCEMVMDILAKKRIVKRRAKNTRTINAPSRPKGANISKEQLEYLAYKIHYSYNDPHIKQIINKTMKYPQVELKTMINKLDQSIKIFEKYFDVVISPNNQLSKQDFAGTIKYHYGLSAYTLRNMIKDIIDRLNMLLEEFISAFAWLMDNYFLRRFLDKDYITNGIVYTGTSHSLRYVFILIKLFHFKITHASYAKNKDLAKVTAKIAQRESPTDIRDLLWPPIAKQCSNMTDFPNDFL